MKVRWWHSLRLRIAGIILLLEALLLGVVLWATLEHDREKARQLIQEQDRVVLELLAQDARQALLTLEFDTLGDLFRRATGNPRILRILLLDRRGVVVASDDRRLLGQRSRTLPQPPPDGYRRRIEIEDLTGNRGTLEVRFSTRRLQQIYRESWRLGLTLGLVGMLLSVLAALAVGHLLTRRLARLTRYAESVARGDPAEPVTVGGQDEVSALARAIDTMVASLHDQTSRMRRMAYRDPLTGLANRVAFRERLEKALASARQYQSRHALLYLDLDQFKLVNDSCGHEAGDRLLAELSRVLRGSLRARDTLARLGGDEFGVLLDRVGLSEAVLVAEKLRQAVDEFRFQVDDKVFRLGVSIGVVEIDADSPDAERLLSLADMACYAAKEKGRNAIEVASDDEAALEQAQQMAWVPELESALAEGRFELLRQAVVALDHPDPPQGWELLLRLRTRDGALLTPDRFLVAAERYHLMPRIEREALRLACEAVRRAPAAYPGRLFLNLSIQSMGDDDFLAALGDLIRGSGLPGERFCFEVRESAAINQFGTVARFGEHLQALGAHLCLDDFGNSLCSLRQLTRLQIEYVKIRGGIVQEMLRSPLEARIARSMIEITREAGFRIIAKQVENDQQRRQLRKLGVELVQGNAVAPPEPLP